MIVSGTVKVSFKAVLGRTAVFRSINGNRHERKIHTKSVKSQKSESFLSRINQGLREQGEVTKSNSHCEKILKNLRKNVGPKLRMNKVT